MSSSRPVSCTTAERRAGAGGAPPDPLPIGLVDVGAAVVLRQVDAAGADWSAAASSDDLVARQLARGRPQTMAPVTLAGPGRAGPAPAALVYHVSRCGSTLLARMLASASGARVVIEPRTLNQALRSTRTGPARAALVRAALDAWAPAEGPWFVKLTSWNVHHARLLGRLLPGVPSVFLFREPGAVLASHRRSPAGWARPDRAGHDLLPGRLRALYGSLLHRCERTPGATLLNYDDGVDGLRAGVLDLLHGLGVAVTATARAALVETCRRDAWDPARPWNPRTDTGRAEDVSPELGALHRRLVEHRHRTPATAAPGRARR